MDLSLNPEQRLVRETARDFTDNEIIERARENDRNEHFDLELVEKIAAQGYLGAIVPRDYGGAGLDYLTYGLIVEEVGRGCSAMRTVISVQTSLVCSGILRWGTEEQKQQYLPKLCSGEWLGCFALTEPDTGSDAANQKTRARKTDSGWVINGSKMFISLGNHAKVALIFAQTDPEKAHRGLACFLVDTDQPGFKPQEIHHKMGLRGSDTAETSLAKLFATEAAVHCANVAIQVHGGSGYVDDYPVERYFRDVRVTTLYEGTSQIQKLIIGRALTGINALVPA